MRTPHTSMGGRQRGFPDTAMELIDGLRGPGPEPYRVALEALARRYWRPIYASLRFGRGKSNDDAKELTQAFFLWLVEGEALRKYAPERGGFRAFLKTLLRRFVGHRDQEQRRLKRGGGRSVVGLDTLVEPPATAPVRDPDAVFDAAWIASVVKCAYARLRELLLADGDDVRLRAYEEYELVPAERRPTYADLAARLGLHTHDVRNHLAMVRAALRAEIRVELARVTAAPRDADEEWRKWFGG